MKKQDGRKTLKWLLPVCILAVLAIVGGVLGLVLGSAHKPAAPQQPKLYWNVDGETYRSGEAVRFVNSDGYVYITFSCDGEQQRLPVADMATAVKIDMLEVMGLEFNEEGIITDCYRVEDITGGIIANRYYVTAVEGNQITCNSSMTLRGYDVTFQITEKTGIWDVGTVGITCGIAGTVKISDQIIAVQDQPGEALAVFVISYTEPMDIYWNVDRKYDSTSKTSTREMDPTGTYTFQLACNGELLTVKTRDYTLASAMDTMAAKCFGLEFDENGYVTKVIHAGTAAGGGSCASWHRVESYRDNQIITYKSGSLAKYNGPVSKEVKVFDVSGHGDFVGQPTEVREGDQVHCLRNSMGQVAVIFVVDRIADSHIYWNVDRKWDAKSSQSTRYPDGNGWYHIKVAVQGEQITVKTQDKAICDLIDGRAAKCFGLKLNGDVIEKFYTPNAVSGGGTFASWYDITELEGNKLACIKATTKDVRSGKLLADCEIYNVSNTANVVGEKTTLRVGDRIHALKDLDGNICVVFVVTRFMDYPVYYNLTQKWDKTNQTTTRTPDEEGYYVFEMAYKGQLVTVKTKRKAIANKIDSQAAKCVALQVSNGIVHDALHPSDTVACKGGPTSSYAHVTSVSAYGFTTDKYEQGVITKQYSETIGYGCKVYNVSDNVISHRGEETKLQKGDLVHCLRNGDGNVVLVYVLSRYEDLGVYYNLDRKWDATNQCSLRTPDEKGLYTFRMAYEGKEVTVQTASVDVANAIDSQAAKVLGLAFDDQGLAIKAIHAKGTEACRGGIGVSYVTVTAIAGDKVTTHKTENDTTVTFTISENPNVFDVSTDVADHQGEKTALRVGDFIHCLKDADGKTNYIYVMSRVPVLEQTEHTCQHVTVDTTWYTWNGKGDFTSDGHYVLTKDVQLQKTITIAQDQKITLCLNGHTLSSESRVFKVYGTLNICDHKDDQGNYRGKITSSYSNTVDTDGNVTGKAFGGIAYLYNGSGSSQLNIYGGNFEHTGSLYSGGLVYISNESDEKENVATFTLYDGVLSGGNTVSTGGAVCISNIGVFIMKGGKITDCTSSGGAVVASGADVYFRMEGGVIENCTATGGGAAVYMGKGLFEMTGGTITKNTATGSGGGVNMQEGKFLMSGGCLDGNTTENEGGNLRINKLAAVVLSGDAKICNGVAKNGGNITTFGSLLLEGNAQITNGTVNFFSNYDDAVADLTVKSGLIDSSIRFGSNKGQVTMNLLGGSVANVNYQESPVTKLYVGGTAQVGKVQVANGKLIQIHAEGLENGASIVVVPANMEAPFAQVTDAADAACFHPVDEIGYKVENRENQLYLVSNIAEHNHCVCVGNTAVEHTCEENTLWQPWTETTSLPTSGRYYLTEDVTLSAMVTLRGKTNLQLCLNGHTITGPGYADYAPGSSDPALRVFLVRDADLTITDCGTTGTITNEAYPALNGGIVYMYSGNSTLYDSSFNLYGGKLIATGKAKAGGILFIGNNSASSYIATFNMYGGALKNGNVSGNGGNVCIGNNCQMYLYGGTISGGQGDSGGNIVIDSGKLALYGGVITGGQAAEFGGGIYCRAEDAISISGNVQITGNASGNLYLAADKMITVETLEGEKIIGISMEDPSKPFARVSREALVDCFFSDDDSFTVNTKDGVLYLDDGVTPVITHIHCICGGHAAGIADHVCDQTVTWEPWDGTTVLEDGHSYYLSDTDGDGIITLASPLTIEKKHVNLCLNGVELTSAGRVLQVNGVKSGSKSIPAGLSLCDCREKSQWGSVTSTSTGVAPILHSYTSGRGEVTIRLFSGKLIAMDNNAASDVGAVRIGNNTSATSTTNFKATFHMYGGQISGGNSQKTGGNLYISIGCQFHMYGGEIFGGTAGTVGGNVYTEGGTLCLLGGSIYGGTAPAGADVYANNQMIVGGSAQIGELYLGGGKTLSVSEQIPFVTGAKIGILKPKAEVFATDITDSKLAEFFECLNDAWQIYHNQEESQLELTQ